jgi:DNA-binding NtrC family response regulator
VTIKDLPMIDVNRKTCNHRLMLVDDEPDILESVTSLESYDFQVSAFRQPLKALSLYKPEFFDVVILDIRMPEMSGLELARNIWQIDPKQRICFFSAFEEYENEALHAFTGKDYCFIRKPVGLRDLVNHINRHLFAEAIAS